MQSLGNACEAALASLVAALNTNVTVVTGQSQDDASLPTLTIQAQDGREEPRGSGNFHLTVSCELRANADDTSIEDFSILSDTIFAPLMSDGLPTEASVYPGFHIFGIEDRQMRSDVVDRSYISTFILGLYCCHADIT